MPGWVPVLGGRRVPPTAALVPATLGGAMSTCIWAFALVGVFTGSLDEISGAGWRALIVVCYLPALLWGPLLLWVTWHHHRRRSP